MSKTMRAWQCAGPGKLEDRLRLVEGLAQPSPDYLTEGQILVRVASVSLNPADYKPIELGALGRAMVSYPKTLCMDLAGHAAAIGPGVTDVKVGDAIMGRMDPLKPGGVLAEYVVLDRECYAEMPESLGMDEAAGVGTAALTEYQAIAPHVKPGDKVFINGGSGGIGTYGIQIAKILGCHVTTTCSTAKVDLCKALGADEVVDYKKTDLVGYLKAAGPEYAVFVDNVGNQFQELHRLSHHFLRPGAQYTVIGLPISLGAVAGLLSASLLPAVLGGGRRPFAMFMTKPSRKDMQLMVQWMREGKLKTVVDSTYGFEEAPAAFAKLKSGSCHGKVIVHVEGKA